MDSQASSIVLTHAEKLQLMPTVAQLIEISSKMRESGILSVENDVYLQNDQFLKLLHNLFCGGYNPDIFRRICNNFLNSSRVNESNLEYSKKFIQAETLLLLHESGQPNYLLNFYCFSYFGFDFREDYKTNMRIHLPSPLYDEIFGGNVSGLWN